MKKLLLLLSFACVFSFTNAQYTLIPDPNFEQALIDLGYDTIADGKVLTSDINTIQSLVISYSNITDLTGIEDFQALTYLDCTYNNLTNLDVTQNLSLSELYCRNNNLTILDVTQNLNLTRFSCFHNNLTSLDVTQNVNLTHLFCSHNNLTRLDVTQNVSLTRLDCTYNNLTSLDVTQNVSLTRLDCPYNNLTNLDLSKSLTEFNCSHNNLTSLDVTQNVSLTRLDCTYNNLTNLDLSKNLNLTIISCSYNDLYSLTIGSNPRSYYCQYNPNLICIKAPFIHEFGGISKIIDAHTTISTGCENFIRGLVFYDINENGIQDLGETGLKGAKVSLINGGFGISRNNGTYRIFTDDTGSVSLKVDIPKKLSCDGITEQQGSVTFPVGGTIKATILESPDTLLTINFGINHKDTVSCGSVSGIVFDDQNGNGIQDTGEDGLRGVTIEFTPGGYTSTDVNGFYSRTFKEGEIVEVSMVNRKQNYGCEDRLQLAQTFPSSSYSFSVVGDKQNNDFGVQSFAGYDVGLYSIRPYASEIGEKFKVMMDYKSDRSIVTDTCTLSLEHDANAVNISATRPPKKKELNRVEWEFLPGETPNWECMGMVFELDEQQTEKGDEITWEATYFCGSDSSTFEDVCNENNTLKRTIQLSSPNVRSRSSQDLFYSMEVFVDGVAEENITNVDTNFSYVINFRNETRDTIYHLYVFDTLPANFNIETVSRPFSNFPYKFHITDERVLVWEMDSIAIPPMKTDPLNSYGFVQFNVIMNQNIAPETAVTNSALIRYNYNGDILPKPTTVYIESPVGFEDDVFQSNSSLLLYPNPTANWVVLQLPENKSIEQPRVELINALGQSFESSFRALTTGTYQVETENITSGIYIVNLWNGDALVGSSRLVKE